MVEIENEEYFYKIALKYYNRENIGYLITFFMYLEEAIMDLKDKNIYIIDYDNINVFRIDEYSGYFEIKYYCDSVLKYYHINYFQFEIFDIPNGFKNECYQIMKEIPSRKKRIRNKKIDDLLND